MTKQDETRKLLDGRSSTYGDTTDNATRVATMWNAYLGIDTITPADMMMMMALYKAYRFKVTPDYADNINDVLGYAQIVKDVQTKTGGLVEAETAKEYQSKKAQAAEQLPDQTEGRNITQWLRNRCGADTGVGPCMLNNGHAGYCQAGALNSRRPAHPYEVADKLAAAEESSERGRGPCLS